MRLLMRPCGWDPGVHSRIEPRLPGPDLRTGHGVSVGPGHGELICDLRSGWRSKGNTDLHQPGVRAEWGGGALRALGRRGTPAFDAAAADTVTYALNKTVMLGTALAARDLDRPAAAKTGTTDDNKSAWFVGYTPDLATAVLMAKEDEEGTPISMSGPVAWIP